DAGRVGRTAGIKPTARQCYSAVEGTVMAARRMRKLGPTDHGRVIPYEQYKFAPWQEGYQYELVDGKLYVFPSPEFPQVFAQSKVYAQLDRYSRLCPEVIDYVGPKCRVYVTNRPGVTSLAPDIGAYRDYPPFDQLRNLHWRDIHPLLVAEVVSREDPEKDLVRNVDLYLQVPSIREYWLV